MLNVSKKEGIFYQTVLTRYFQERVLYRLSQTRYRDHFFLKGGALMYAHERFAARPTLDIDFLGSGISNDGGQMVSAFREIFPWIGYVVSFRIVLTSPMNKW
ncbi:MAG: nucleotidyl transferase AbiEii/AbiGii toxin family protein [Bacteroidales bacterium]|nr:nucleotidyl transferase AbiEii/AbiGii toxin family protein [Bacteroidales bacterium]